MRDFLATSEVDLYTIEERLVISEMTAVELVETVVLRMPDVVGSLLQIGCSLRDGMLVETVETRFVDDIEDSLLGMTDGQRRVAGCRLSIRLHGNHRTEMDALPAVASGMSRHRQLGGDGLHLMGHLCRQRDTVVQVVAL